MSHETCGAGKGRGVFAPTNGVVVGIDPGLDRHGCIGMVAGSGYVLGRRMVPNTVAGMAHLVERLREWQERSGGRLAIGMEEATAYGEALACYLTQAGFEVVVVTALQVARFREALGPDRNDLIDAEVVARLLMVQPDLARPAPPGARAADAHAAEHQRLRQLSRRHGRWTREQTATCNELHAVLRMAWLADYQAFFSQVHGVAALAFWQQYPTPVEAVSADPVVMAELIHEASRGRISATQAAERAAKIQMCARFMVAAFGRDNPQRWSGWAKEIVCLAGHLAYLRQGLKELAAEMDELLEAIDSPLRSFSGLGTVTAATIHGETLGIERFATADHFARYNGTAPREDSSGRRPKHVKNRRCNTRLRRAMLQLALNAPRYHAESRDYLARLAARGIVRGAARLRLARRLSDIVYALLRDGKEYDHTAHAKKRPKAA